MARNAPGQGMLAPKRFWDAYWNLDRDLDPDHNIFDAVLRRYLPVGGEYLEVGCGPGTTMVYFHRNFQYRVTGLDFSSAEIVQRTMQRYGIASYRVIDHDFLTWETTLRFDVVASFGVVEHFTDVPAVIHRHARLVLPGGYLVIEVPNLRWVNGLLYRILQPRMLRMHNRTAMRPKALVEPLGDGFDVLHAGYFGTSPLDFDLDNPLVARWPGLRRAMIAVRALLRRRGLGNVPSALLSPYIIMIARRRPEAPVPA